jgi:hypothetical protein
MTLLTRSTLKNLFTRGAVPTEVNFSDFIDSTVNKVDDGFSQSPEFGFMLAPQGANRRLMSFFESIRDSDPAFSLSLNRTRHAKGLSVDILEEQKPKSILFLKDTGEIGIGTTSPRFELEVNGMVGANGRVGTFASGSVNADGEWQTIIDRLEGVQAFEVIAHASGKEGRGKYALTHAIAVSNYGVGKINQVRSTYNKILGPLFHRVTFRWAKGNDGYRLQVKTTQNYGYLDDKEEKRAQIKYYVTKLWDTSMATKEEESKKARKVR